MTNDKPLQCVGCVLYEKGHGFALDTGDPLTAKYALILEAPGKDEIAYRLLDPKPHDPLRGVYDRHEYERRLKAYPGIAPEYLRKGQALVGKSWGVISQWCFKRLGVKREDLFISNVLRCLPPKSKSGDSYPTGDERKQAELYCRRFDVQLRKYAPKLAIITLHPASLARSITPLPLLIRSCEKLRDCGEQGIRAALLCGGKSVKLWLGYFDSVVRYQGHYAWLKPTWFTDTLARLTKAAGTGKKTRKKKGDVAEPTEDTPRGRNWRNPTKGVKELFH